MKRIAILLLLSGLAMGASAQNETAEYYRFPLDLPHLYSAGFAEMRPNHFHSGVDIKTGGVEGQTLYAAADGEIVRIGVQPSGYGRVLYIQHPNGTTTVYAHMQSFEPRIEDFLQAERYRLRRSTGDFYPAAGQLRVARGEKIGLSGNSGSSGGPHLHFEIRRTATQRTLNTIAAGLLPVEDDIPPLIFKVHYIEVDTVQGVPVHSRPRALGVRRLSAGSYEAASSEPLGVGRRGYLLLEASDRKNNVSNTFGLYRVTARIDGEIFYEYRMDGFAFDLSRYCNAVAYYPLQRRSRNEVFRLAQLDGNIFPYSKMVDRGTFTTAEKQVRHIDIEVEDDCGNVSHLGFDVRGRSNENSFRAVADSTATVADNRREFKSESDGLSVRIPAGALYEPIFYRQGIDEAANAKMNARQDTTLLVLSDVYSIGDEQVPLQKAVRISISGFIPEALRSRATIASVSESGGLWQTGGKYRDGAVSCTARSFGRYCIAVDLLPPSISAPFASGSDLSRERSVSFRLRDNFSGIESVVLTIDGKWAAWEHKSSSSPYVHRFDDERFGRGRRHTMVLTVTDGVGNTSVWRGEYVR